MCVCVNVLLVSLPHFSLYPQCFAHYIDNKKHVINLCLMIKCLMSNMRGRIYLSKDSLVPARDACTYRKYYPDVALFIYDGSFLVETCIDLFAFGCAGSSFLQGLFSVTASQGYSSYPAQAPPCGGFSFWGSRL